MRLVVADGYRRALVDATDDAATTRILAVGYPPQSFIDAARRDGKLLRPDVFLPVEALAFKARQSLREFVPRFYADLPTLGRDRGRSLAATLFPGDPETWWLTDISEKSIFRGHLIARLYVLALLREAVQMHRPTEVWIALTDNSLSDVIVENLSDQCRSRRLEQWPWMSGWMRASRKAVNPAVSLFRAVLFAWGTLAELVLLRVIAGPHARSDMESPGRRRVALFSFFPGWWRQPWDPGSRREVFYQGLPQRLKAGGLEVCHTLWLGLKRRGLFRQMKGMWHLCRSDGFLCLPSLVRMREAIGLLGVKPLVWCLRVMRLYPKLEECVFAGFCIGRLVQDDLLTAVSQRELFRNLLLRTAVAKLPKYDLMLFRTEFQPFERAILQGLKAQATPTVGYQHSSVGRDYLSHLFVPEQFRCADDNGVGHLPTPDHLVMTGRYVAQLMQENGFLAERLHVAGPLRYQELRTRLYAPSGAHVDPVAQGRRTLMVPVSLDRREALGFAAVLAAALNGQEHRFVLNIKGHPANDHARDFADYLRHQNDAFVVHVVSQDTSLHDCICSANALVMTGSTVGLEAIALGVPVILFINDHIFSFTASSLLAVEQAIINVRDPTSLREALHRLREEETPFLEVRQFWPGAIQEMFDNLEADPEDRFFAIVNDILRNCETGTFTSAYAV